MITYQKVDQVKGLIIKNWKTIVMIFLGFLFLNSRCSVSKYKTSLGRLSTAMEIKDDSVRYLEGKNGELISERSSQQFTIDELKSHGESLGVEMDALEDQVGNLKNIISHLSGELEAANSGSTTLGDGIVIVHNDEGQPVDSVKVKKLDWTDNYLTLNGTYFPHNSKFDFTYKYKVKFTSTVFYKKDGMFKDKYPVVQLKFDDPNAKLNEADNLIIIPPEKKFYQRPIFWGGVGLLGGLLLGI